MRVIVLIPAHNEEECLPAALHHLVRQTRKPDRVIVVADNCTDNTIRVTKYYQGRLNLSVVETVNNESKKAGALNQALDRLLPSLEDSDSVLVMDADSYLNPDFVSNAIRILSNDRFSTSRYGAVGGTFTGRSGGGFVGFLQRNEFARYGRDTRKMKGKVLCLTGTATLFKVSVLRKIKSTRPSIGVYDTSALTEDFEITLALQTLGYQIVSPRECTLTTEVMESWKDLGKQRLRWKRGAVECLGEYGLSWLTMKHWARQAFTLLGITVTVIYLLSLLVSLILFGGITIQPFWLGVTLVFVVERVITVTSRGWKASFISAFLIFEMPYDIFLQVVHLLAYWKVVMKRERSW